MTERFSEQAVRDREREIEERHQERVEETIEQGFYGVAENNPPKVCRAIVELLGLLDGWPRSHKLISAMEGTEYEFGSEMELMDFRDACMSVFGEYYSGIEKDDGAYKIEHVSGYIERLADRDVPVGGLIWEEILADMVLHGSGGISRKQERTLEKVHRLERLTDTTLTSALVKPDELIVQILRDLERVAVARELVPEDTNDVFALGENFEESPLHELYQKRREQDRDMKMIITARNSETGTGKTSLAVSLAEKWDVHGWTADKATLSASQYMDMFDEQREGSVLLLDEGEQAADNRRSMSSDNVDLSHVWATMRYRQVFTITTLPSVSMLDKRLKELADIRVNVTRRGHARVYRIKIDDFDSSVYEEHICDIEWDAIDDDPEYQRVEEMKAERMEGQETEDDDDDDDTVNVSKVRREARDELIRELVDGGMQQTAVADRLDMSQSMVSRIVNEGD